MSEEVFHLTMARLAPGSVVKAGNWGRLLHRYQNDTAVQGQPIFGNSWILARELLFELERTRNHPAKPSRFFSSFAFAARDGIDEYRAINDRPRAQVLHRAEFVTPQATRHVGSLSLIHWPPPDTSFLDIMTERVAAYWRGGGTGPVEIISLSDIRILEPLE